MLMRFYKMIPVVDEKRIHPRLKLPGYPLHLINDTIPLISFQRLLFELQLLNKIFIQCTGGQLITVPDMLQKVSAHFPAEILVIASVVIKAADCFNEIQSFRGFVTTGMILCLRRISSIR